MLGVAVWAAGGVRDEIRHNVRAERSRIHPGLFPGFATRLHVAGVRTLRSDEAFHPADRCAFHRAPGGGAQVQDSLNAALRIFRRRSLLIFPCQRERASLRSWSVNETNSAVPGSGKSGLVVTRENQGPS